MSIWGFPLITALVAGDIVASESQNGTLKTILTRSRDRGQVFAGKVLAAVARAGERSEEHTSELQSLTNIVCRLLLEKKKSKDTTSTRDASRRATHNTS